MSLPKKKRKFPIRYAAMALGAFLLFAALTLIDLSPDLSHLDVTMSSGPTSGNYFAVGERLHKAASEENGSLRNVESKGSVNNITRLAEEADDCNVHFALVQDGVPGPKGSELELIARLPRSESVFILGKAASQLTDFESMRGLRVGVGPKGSGTDHLVRSIFESDDFAPLALQLSNHDVEEQMTMAKRGDLDLAVFVLDEDATLIRDAMRSGMQMAAFEHLDILARRFSFLSHGRVGSGQFDPLRVIPKEDQRVLRVDTLVLGNDCASRTETIALLTLLRTEFPTILVHNRRQPGSAYFHSSHDAREFIINGGPEWADIRVPWLVNIMPLGNWFYIIMAISVLFNIMTALHKFRLWRIDAIRDRNQQVFRDLLGAKLTPAEIFDLEIRPEHLQKENIAKIDAAMLELDLLRVRCRKQENSATVPMGQEIVYRFQEEQIELSLVAMRDFRRRVDVLLADKGEAPEETLGDTSEEVTTAEGDEGDATKSRKSSTT